MRPIPSELNYTGIAPSPSVRSWLAPVSQSSPEQTLRPANGQQTNHASTRKSRPPPDAAGFNLRFDRSQQVYRGRSAS
jgi:hypothetical protein